MFDWRHFQPAGAAQDRAHLPPLAHLGASAGGGVVIGHVEPLQLPDAALDQGARAPRLAGVEELCRELLAPC